MIDAVIAEHRALLRSGWEGEFVVHFQSGNVRKAVKTERWGSSPRGNGKDYSSRIVDRLRELESGRFTGSITAVYFQGSVPLVDVTTHFRAPGPQEIREVSP